MPLKKHLFGLLVVAILSGVASYSNVAKQFQLASVSGCYTQSQIDELTKEKATLDLGIENNTKLYNSAVSEIERLTALLTPSSTISAKYTEAINYLNIRNASRKNPKVAKRYNTLYTTAIASYNTMVTNNTSYSSQITKFTADKTTYQNNINTLSTVLAGTLSEITTANSNKCSTTTTTGTTTTTTTSSYVADTGSHSICSTDEECANGEICITSMCVTPGSDICATNSDCHSGDICSAGNCVESLPTVCNNSQACNYNEVGDCEFISCYNSSTDLCTPDQSEEYGWKIGGWEISIDLPFFSNNKSPCGGKDVCQNGWTNDYTFKDDREPYLRAATYKWGCKKDIKNCETGRLELTKYTCELSLSNNP